MLLYNTLTRKKEEFEPLTQETVGIYVCGITAYDHCHIGHARSCVIFDVLVRYFRRLGYKVNYVRNFTDVDDKIIKKAEEEGMSSQEVAEKFIQAFQEDMEQLNVLKPDIEPKATEHIPEMINIIQRLMEKGYAYSTSGGDVYFRVRTLPHYGSLSGRNIEELQAGSRVDPGEEKEDPMDFVLWKSAKKDEPYWESPWGKGRPGWHIECSAMSEKYLGIPFDIHGGGQDLSFPHHENEKAQSEAAFDKEFARYWVHNGFVRVNAEKMSKSLGNFVVIKDILRLYHGEVIRFFLLTNHYRSPLDYSDSSLLEAEKALKRVYWTKAVLEKELERQDWKKGQQWPEFSDEVDSLVQKWNSAMEDDLNTAEAVGHMFSLTRVANRMLENKALRKSEAGKDLMWRVLDCINNWGEVLGVLTSSGQKSLKDLKLMRCKRENIDPENIQSLVQKRQMARKEKDFSTADQIRNDLAALGIEVMDTPEGPKWDFT